MRVLPGEDAEDHQKEAEEAGGPAEETPAPGRRGHAAGAADLKATPSNGEGGEEDEGDREHNDMRAVPGEPPLGCDL